MLCIISLKCYIVFTFCGLHGYGFRRSIAVDGIFNLQLLTVIDKLITVKCLTKNEIRLTLKNHETESYRNSYNSYMYLYILNAAKNLFKYYNSRPSSDII